MSGRLLCYFSINDPPLFVPTRLFFVPLAPDLRFYNHLII